MLAEDEETCIQECPTDSFENANSMCEACSESCVTFTLESYLQSVLEDIPLGSVLVDIEAVDRRQTQGAILYEIMSGNEEGTFSLDPGTGSLSLLSSLDFETRSTHGLTVRALGVSGQSATATVLVFVSDINDNTPSFSQQSYAGLVAENALPGTSILQVSASDADSAANGAVTYTLSGESADFMVDSNTGELMTRRSLDFEATQSYSLTVIASDSGVPSLSASAQVTINVGDENDVRPTFPQATLSVEISELSRVESSVVQLQAIDPDTDDLTYFLIEGNEEGKFEIDAVSGLVSLAALLDFELADLYSLVASVHDGVTTSVMSNVTITVRVLDENDNSPQFSEDTYTVQVPEDLFPGASVLTVLANDSDSGDNGAIQYSIGSVTPSQPLFSIDTVSGVVSTISALDYENQTSYQIRVVASDLGDPAQSSTSLVLVLVSDLNDNAPVFRQGPAVTITHTENLQEGAELTVFEATDADTGTNAQIVFSLQYVNTVPFQINPSSGVVTLSGALDYETETEYQVEVVASDLGSPAMSSTISLTLLLLDQNDNTPVFTQEQYSVSISETHPEGSSVLQVTASDRDTGDNAVIRYFITAGNINSAFEINATNGLISLANSVDFETVSQYRLSVTAVNSLATNQLAAAVMVTVQVQEVNEFVPMFLLNSYQQSVVENLPAGLSLLDVVAADNDEGPSGELNYQLSSGNDRMAFQILDNGTLTSLISLDRELQQVYNLTVTVSDEGVPSFSTSTTVLVTVLDVNDSPPLFLISTSYTANLLENAVGGTDISLTPPLRVSDDDQPGSDNTEITFRIVSGDPDQVFTINSLSGQLQAVGLIDFEQTSQFELVLEAADNGTPPLSSTATVSINILDVNDNPPRITNASAQVIFTEGQDRLLLLPNITVSDADSLPLSLARVSLTAPATIAGDVGVLSLDMPSSGITLSRTDNGQTIQLIGLFSPQTLTAVLQTLEYVNLESEPDSSTRSITLLIADGDFQTSFQTSIFLQLINDNAPSLDLDVSSLGLGFSTSFVEEGSPVGIAGEVAVSDEDESMEGIATVRVSLLDPKDSSLEGFLLESVPAGLTVQYLDNNHTLVITSSPPSSFQSIESLLPAILYFNTADEPTLPLSRVVEVVVSDGELTSLPATASVSIVLTDDPPLLALGPNTDVFLNFVEGGEPVSLSSGLTLVDVDTQLLTNASVSLVDTPDGVSEMVSFDGPSHERLTISSTQHSITIQGPAAVADFSSVLSSVRYENILQSPDPSVRRAVFAVSDGTSVSQATAFISFNLVNDPPVLDLNGPPQGSDLTSVFVEGSPSIPVTSAGLTITDVDSPNIDYVSILLTSSPDGTLEGLTVEPASSPGLTITSSLTVIDLTGPALASSYASILSGVRYFNNAEEPTEGDRVVIFVANDGELNSTVVQSTITVQSVNDAPVLVLNGGSVYQVEYFEEALAVSIINVEEVVLTDSDNDTLVSLSVLLTNVFDDNSEILGFSDPSSDGSLSVQSAPGMEVNSRTVTFQFSAVSSTIDNFLDLITSLTYRSTSLEPTAGTRIIAISISDGLSDSTVQQSTITLLLLNDNAPVFQRFAYQGRVFENVVDVTVTTVVASDADSSEGLFGDQGRVLYQITSGNDDGTFDIDSSTGEITVKIPRDRESSTINPVLTVQASNPADLDISASLPTTFVIITVADVNDNSPQFLGEPYFYQVTENAQFGTVVGMVLASDADAGSNSEIEYTIAQGNINSVFAIDRETGEISVANSGFLDRERASTITLSITATDGGSPPTSNTTVVTIQLLDENDNAPEFPMSSYSQSISEAVPANTSVLTVLATDADADRNGALLYMLSGTAVFGIDGSSGEITTLAPLDRELETEHRFTVTASDGGEPGMTSSTQVVVTVVDVNDNSPAFQQGAYAELVTENTPVGQLVGTVFASDPDSGSNAQIRYSLVDVVPFAVDPETGTLVVSDLLDREEREQYNFTVQASDAGTPQRSTDVTFTVTVLDVNDNSPVFVQSPYAVQMPENVAIFFPVVTVEAVDDDIGTNAVITFSIADGRDTFQIDPSTGEVFTIASVDFEQQSFYTLDISACDNALCATTTLSINVTDQNDNTPVFNVPQYQFTVRENLIVDVLGTVLASDGDTGTNADIVYSIVDSAAAAVFSVGLMSGTLSVISALDRETVSSYNFSIMATDLGSPPLSSIVTVFVAVEDSNDNAPVFSQTSYSVSAMEDLPVGSILLTVSAEDEDIGSNGNVVYAVVAGGFPAQFIIGEDSGELVLARSLDAESALTHTVQIRVSDSSVPAQSTLGTILITVTDVNDEPVSIFAPTTSITYEEESLPVSLAANISVTDTDVTGAVFNATVELIDTQTCCHELVVTDTIKTQFPGVLIEEGSIVIVQGPVTPAMATQILMSVLYTNTNPEPQPDSVLARFIVHDGLSSDMVDITVSVTTVNDNPPVVTLAGVNANFSTSFTENSASIRAVDAVTISDADSDQQTLHSITVSLLATPDGSMEALSAESFGSVSVFPQAGHMLVLSGPAPLQDFVSSLSSLRYVNNAEAPQQPLQRVIEVVANDGLLQSKPTYSTINIVSVNDPPLLLLSSSGDFNTSFVEDGPAVSLTDSSFSLSDPDSPALQSAVISVSNVMDFGSEFLSISSQHVDVAQQSDTEIALVGAASVADFASALQTLVYFNNATNPSPFVREVIFTVSDGELATSALAFVLVELVNDPPVVDLNGPSLPDIDHEVTFIEGGSPVNIASNNSFITDTDSATLNFLAIEITQPLDGSSEVLLISDLSDGVTSTFSNGRLQVNTEADITTYISLLRRIQYVNTADEPSGVSRLLEVVCGDGELLSQAALSTVQFTLVNDPPLVMLDDGGDFFTVYQENSPAISIVNGRSTSITDVDSSTLSYITLEVRNLLDRDMEFINFTDPSGDLSVVMATAEGGNVVTYNLSYQQPTPVAVFSQLLLSLEYVNNADEPNGTLSREVRVVVSDGELVSQAVTSTIIIRLIDDNEPLFAASMYLFNITEGAAIGTEVGFVSATDVDLGDIFLYQLSTPDVPFAIDVESGVLTITGDIDQEREDQYELIVQLTRTIPPFSLFGDQALIVVDVLDINDNAPMFNQSLLGNLSVSEDVEPGFVVATVEAFDADIGTNADLVFSLEGTSTFEINSLTGELATVERLDREATQSYEFTVRVEDGGLPSLVSSAVVIVQVLDVNDEQPQFQQTSYITEVVETVPMGTTLLQLSAQDGDTGSNALIRFSLSPVVSQFTLDADDGVIITATTPLLPGVFNFTATASDGGTPPLTSSVAVTVEVIAFNSTLPVFSQPLYEASVVEHSSQGVVVVDVDAADPVTGDAVNYLSTENTVFSIDSTTGLITTTGVGLDRELQDVYQFQVFATSSDGERMGVASVSIRVLDANDFAPVFSQPSYSFNSIENNGVGDILGAVLAVDTQDIGTNAQVAFYIASHENFTVSSAGLVSTGVQFDREVLDAYSFEVFAVDSGTPAQTSSASVMVSILDDNDEPPVFTLPSYEGEVAENLPLGTPILTVTATDSDLGSNAAVAYSTNSTTFSVDSQTGVLSTLAVLDFESADNTPHVVFVVATDDGFPFPLSSVVIVTISVLDVDDSAPMFSMATYFTRAQEEQLHTSILTVAASDSDSPEENVINFEIVSGDSRESFAISPGGIISVVQPLDREVSSQHVITIQASSLDASGSILSSTAIVTVEVVDINDNSPVFLGLPYELSISEAASDGTVLSTLSATDSDSATNANIGGFSIVEGNSDNVFSLGLLSGILRLSNESLDILDRESVDRYELTVVVTDNGSPPLFSTVNVTISILDANDEPPTFSQPSYTISVNESSPIGTTVFSADGEATDADLGSNAELTFSLAEPSTDFAISPDGTVTVVTSLDFESQQLHSLVVRASDGGSPSLVGIAVLNINVLDQDDLPVEFVLDSFVAGTFEDSVSGTVVLTVLARDPDTVQDNPITYSIQQASEIPLPFSVDSQSGAISVAGLLDRETVPMYLFTVLASNTPGVSASATVMIDVLDVNDITPQFTGDLQFQLSESLTPGFVIGRVSVSDGDEGSSGEIALFALEGAPSSVEIDPFNGTLLLVGTLDFEDVQEYVFNVTATDGGSSPLTGQAEVTVSITDVNDNTPRFSMSAYQTVVSENAPIGLMIFTVAASDLDSGTNGAISFTLAQQSAEFAIDSQSGEVSTLARLLIRNYTILLAARDEGSPSLTSMASLVVVVTDANERPTFTQESYSAVIPEDRALGSLVLQVTATDPDSGINAELSYSIDQQDQFSIDESTGRITVSQLLDFELQETYTVSVYASDNGLPSLNTSALVRIQLTDANDNAPIFSASSYNASIPENTPTSTTFLVVSATDLDSSTNAAITYSILQDSSFGSVAIDTQSGAIFLIEALDYESLREVQLVIQARDGGSSFRTSTVPVTVSITDVDDNSPVFSQSTPYLMSVGEELGSGAAVISVQASDSDEGENAIIQYILTNSTDLPFDIGLSTGDIFVAGPGLDRELESEYSLTVEASNPFSPLFTATALVLVTVLDFNDNQPVFDAGTLQTSTLESSPVGTTIGRVAATDSDVGDNGIIRYSLDPPSPLVSVDSVSGDVRVESVLDFETMPTLDLTVLATDSGTPALSIAANYRISIQNVNDEVPTITSMPSEFTFVEGSSPTLDIGSGIVLADADMIPIASASVKLFIGSMGTLPPSDDFIQLDTSQSGALGLTVSSSTTCINITGAGTTGTYASLLGRLQFGSTADEPVLMTRTVSLEVFDGIFTSVPLLITVEIESVNDNDPILDLSLGTEGLDYQTSFTEGDIFALLVGLDGSLFDLDGDMIQSVRINLTNGIDPEERLGSFAFGEVQAEMTSYGLELVGPASTSAFVLALQTVYYENSADEPSDPQQARMVTFVASDGERQSLPATAVITILLVNDAPVIRLMGSAARDAVLVYSESESSLDLVPESLSISDVDSDMLSFVNVTITSFQSVEDQLDYSTEGYNITAQFLSGTLLVSGPATAEDFTAVLQTLQYVNSFLNSDQLDNLQGGKSVQFTVSDGSLTSPIATAFITFSGVNDAPILDLNGPEPGGDFAATFTEGDDNVMITSPLLTITDVDSTDLVSMTAVLNGILDSNELLTATLDVSGLITQYDSSTNELTIQGPSSTANYESILQSLVYENANSDLTPGVRTVTITASDGSDTSNPVLVTITVLILNDPPQLTLVPLGTVFVEEGDPVALVVPDSAQITDSDNQTLSSVTVQLENALDGADESISISSTVVGLVVSSEQSEEEAIRSYIFSFAPESLGTVEEFTAIVQRLSYTNISPEPAAGTRRVNITVSDGLLTSTTTSILVTVQLVNDNVPVFVDEVLQIPLPEDTSPQTSIFQSSATDGDVDSAISYSIDSPSPFTISDTTGIVSLVASIDREMIDSYNLSIAATDGENTAIMFLSVEVTDINDNSPLFTMRTYTANIVENTPLGTSVLRLAANDADEGSNADISYSIGDGNAQRVFAINSTSGELFTSASVNFELAQSYSLSIIVEDLGVPSLTDMAFVVISISDINDNTPVFSPSIDAITMGEDTQLFTVLYSPQAFDADANTDLTYSLVNGSSELFAVDPDTGEIALVGELDFESESAHIITVQVSDGLLDSIFTLTLSVLDIDDSKPSFVMDMYIVSITENASISTDILTGMLPLAVVDMDTGPNAAVEFTLLSGDPLNQFSLNALSSDTAQLILVGGLDREVIDEYTLILLAQNPTDPSQNDTAAVMITVTDINDSPPEFDSPAYNFFVTENAVGGSVVGQVSAVDADEGSNSEVQYFLTGDSTDVFNISSSGEIILASDSLDFETLAQFILVVIAMDGGSPAMSSQSIVTVSVLDINDNPPIFNVMETTIDLAENAPPSTTVAILTAEDEDTGLNGEVRYSVALDSVSRFSVDPITGILTTTANTLDFESDPTELVVVVTARDGGSPELSSDARVVVTLLDVNEFPPEFALDSTQIPVSESLTPFTIFLDIKATDGDAGIAGVIEYAVTDQTPSPSFSIDNTTGEISTTASLDRENTDTYVITVIATNPLALPFLSAQLTLTINVQDINDNVPSFSQDEYRVAVTTNLDVGAAILAVTASDADTGSRGDILYSIANENTLFDISAMSGVIVLASELTSTGVFNLVVVATDQGSQPLVSSATVIINVIQPLTINFNQQGAGFLLDQASATTQEFGFFVNSPPEAMGSISATLGDVTASTSYSISLPQATRVRGVVLSDEVWYDDPEISVVVQVADDLGDVYCSPTQVVITILPDNQLRALADINLQVNQQGEIPVVMVTNCNCFLAGHLHYLHPKWPV